MPFQTSKYQNCGVQESAAGAEEVGGNFVKIENNVEAQSRQPPHYQDVMKYYRYQFCRHDPLKPDKPLEPMEIAEIAGLHHSYKFPNQTERRQIVSAWLSKIISNFSDKPKARNMFKKQNQPSCWPSHIEYCSPTNNKKKGEGRHTSEELDYILQCLRPALIKKIEDELAKMNGDDRNVFERLELSTAFAEAISKKLGSLPILEKGIKEEIKDEKLSVGHPDSQPHTKAPGNLVPGNQGYTFPSMDLRMKSEPVDIPEQETCISSSQSMMVVSSSQISGQAERILQPAADFSPYLPTVLEQFEEPVRFPASGDSASAQCIYGLTQQDIDAITKIVNTNANNPISRGILAQIEFRSPEPDSMALDDHQTKEFLLNDDEIKNSRILQPTSPIFAQSVAPISAEFVPQPMRQQEAAETEEAMDMESLNNSCSVRGVFSAMGWAPPTDDGHRDNSRGFDVRAPGMDDMEVENNDISWINPLDPDLLKGQPDFQNLLEMETGD